MQQDVTDSIYKSGNLMHDQAFWGMNLPCRRPAAKHELLLSCDFLEKPRLLLFPSFPLNSNRSYLTISSFIFAFFAHWSPRTLTPRRPFRIMPIQAQL
jgi:hypothetical protein